MDIPDHINENIEAISDLHFRAERRLTIHQRGIERVTNSLGRPVFLYGILSLVGLWIAINLAVPSLGLPAFDPPPFNLLSGAVSLSALVIATLVLITQNHQLSRSSRSDQRVTERLPTTTR